MNKSSLGFQKGESSLHVAKHTKLEPKEPIENNGNDKSNKQRNQQHIHQQNQQHQRRKPQGASTFRKYFSPRKDSDKTIKFQRKQIPFVPFVHNVECYSCHKFGHVATKCKRRMYRFNQQILQQYQ